MPNFSDILDKTPSQTEKPPTPPVGTYIWSITGLAKKQDRKEFEVLDFPCKAVSAGPDVDQEALANFGGVKNIPPQRVSFLFNKEDETRFLQTENRLKKFLGEHLGLDENLPYKVLFNEAINRNFAASTRIRTDDNTGDQYFEIDRTAPAE